MKIVIFSQEVLWNDEISVPIESDVMHKIEVLVAEKESVLPIFLIFIYNLLFYLT